MPKKKDQKKKERERRVAQKKLVEAQKRAKDKSTQEDGAASPKVKRTFTVPAIQKREFVPTSQRSPFTQRRSSGG